VEVLECHKEVAGFIYAVIGVLYAVLLGFTAIIVWERYEKAHSSVEQEANEVADLFRDAQVFPNELRNELESQLRTYVRLVLEREWPAMAEGGSSRETWEAYNQLWPTYQRIRPQDEREKAWYTLSLTRLNELGDYRRLRLLSNRSAVPGVCGSCSWVAEPSHRLQLSVRYEKYRGPGRDDSVSRSDNRASAVLDPGHESSLRRDHPRGATCVPPGC
jgi:hypothetical protein